MGGLSVQQIIFSYVQRIGDIWRIWR